MSWLSNLFRREGEPEDDGPGGSSKRSGPRTSSHDYSGTLPAWAELLETPERYKVFLDSIVRYFELRKTPVTISEGTATSSGDRSLGLYNVMQTCAFSASEEWNGLIAAHFDSMDRIYLRWDGAEQKMASFEGCKDQLRLRMWDEDEAQDNVPAIRQEGPPGLLAALMLDLPEAAMPVLRKRAEAWGVGEAVVFDTALNNTFNEVLPTVGVRKLPDEMAGLFAVEAESIYTASLIRSPERLPLPEGLFGVFLSAPAKQVILACPFNGMEDASKLNHMIGLTRHLFNTGTAAVSRRVWWYCNGKFDQIVMTPHERDGQQVLDVHIPARLGDLMMDLRGDEDLEDADDADDADDAEGDEPGSDDEPDEPDGQGERDGQDDGPGKGPKGSR